MISIYTFDLEWTVTEASYLSVSTETQADFSVVGNSRRLTENNISTAI